MIVGICVGSGIFFKVGNILAFTGGNVLLGVLVFFIGALCIIFGSLSLTNLASRTTKNGGMVAYFEDFYSNSMASAFGWYQTFLYYPTIAVVVSWAAGIYTTLLLNLPQTIDIQMGIGFLYMLLFYSINIYSKDFAGKFQVISTITKLIPLIGIGLLALFWTKEPPAIPSGVEAVPVSNVGWGWVAALAPMAFSYDGWPIALSISNEVKGGHETMKKALFFGPIIVLAVYLCYFLGLTAILGPEYILSTGEGAVMAVGNMILGSYGEIIILMFILIALFGVINGVTLGHIRMPYALATKDMMPESQKIIQSYEGTKKAHTSALIAFLVSIGWFVIHYTTQRFNLIGAGDVSEIAIVFGYLWYIALYVKVFQMFMKKQITDVFTGFISPILAILGGLIILFGGFHESPYSTAFFFLICSLFCISGFMCYKYNKKHNLEVNHVD